MFNNLLYVRPAPFDFVAIFGNFLTEWYYYAALFALVAIIVLIALFLKPIKKLKLTKTQRTALIAILSAVSVVCNMLSFGPDSFKISLVIAVGFISGSILGASGGFAVGFIGDLIAGFIAPQGVYNPLIGAASGMWGFLVGVAFYYVRGFDYAKTAVALVVAFIISSMCINTIATYYMFGFSKRYATLLSYLAFRMPTQLGNLAINLAVSLALIPTIRKLSAKYIEELVREKSDKKKLADVNS